MSHRDYQCLQQIRSHWKKEQQLIRRKYQIPYLMTSTAQRCFNKPISVPLQTGSQSKEERITVVRNDTTRKINRIDESCVDQRINGFHTPLMYCSKCHFNLTECLCQDDIGQKWAQLPKRSHSTDKILKKKSLSKSISERHVSFETSLIDLSSIQQTNSQKTKRTSHKHQYILLDWNNHQSLLNFIQTTQLISHSSHMSIEQLHQLILRHDHIHVFNSIIDLILTMTREQSRISLCHIYIDPLYYLTLSDAHPLSPSHLIADNINLHQTLHSVRQIAILLGAKIDQQYMNESLPFRPTRKQRQSILNQQNVIHYIKNAFQHLSASLRSYSINTRYSIKYVSYSIKYLFPLVQVPCLITKIII